MCSYRERMADYASMRALDVWYDRIDLDRVLKVLPSGAEVDRVRQRVEQARRKSLPESLFSKLVEHLGSAPRIKDVPPLIFHPTAEQAPGVGTGYAEALEGYRKSLPGHIRVLFRPVSALRPRDQGRRRGQRRHLLCARAVYGGR